MRPLFLRILAVLIASFIGVLIVAFLLFRWADSDFESDHERLRALALVSSGKLVDAYLAGKPKPALQRLERRLRAKAWVVDRDNLTLFGPEVPEYVLSKISSFPAFVSVLQGEGQSVFILGNQIVRQNKTYQVIIESKGIKMRQGPLSIAHGPRLFLLLLSLIVASALLSYWVLRPVKAFLETTRKLSGESLDARVSPAITGRRDAFGDLGTEFNKMTERLALALESQRQLLRDVSHELRSPLARIQVAATLLDQKLGEQSEIQRIESEVARLDELIERLLSLSRLQNDQGMQVSRIELQVLLSELITNANYEFAQQDKQVSLQLNDDLNLQADPELIASAIENVIRNGLRFTSKEGGVLVTYFDQPLGSTPGVRIEVSDHGPGMEPSDLTNMFEPFFQADSSRQTSNTHYGIGLALARTIVLLHKGKIEAENRKQGGLCVSIWLPLVPV